MIRMLLVFFAMWGAVFFGFSYFWHMTREEKFDMLKLAFYSFLTALVAFIILVGIVVLF